MYFLGYMHIHITKNNLIIEGFFPPERYFWIDFNILNELLITLKIMLSCSVIFLLFFYFIISIKKINWLQPIELIP